MVARKPDPERRITPFSNGTEYVIWLDRNCDRCRKQYDPATGEAPCDIEESLSVACLTDGKISAEMARRSGLNIRWDRPQCHEFEPIGTHDDSVPVIRPAPGQLELF